MTTDTIGKYTLDAYVELTRECCPRCGVQFALPTAFQAERLRDRSRDFYCPNGHSLFYAGKTEADRLREQLEAARRYQAETRRELAAERRSHAATKGKVTRLRTRAKAGMCAECNRTFADYARHMATKHAADNGRKPGRNG